MRLIRVSIFTALALASAAISFHAFGQTSPSPTPSAAATTPAIQTSTTSVGTFLTDSQGKSLYVFAADTQGKSTCTGACATVWPPFTGTSGQNVGTSGQAQSSLVGNTARPDGTQQVTYKNQPLYYYAGDTTPGNTNGQGISSFGANWYLVQPDGTPITSSSGSSSTPSGGGTSSGGTSGSGGGTGY